MIARLITRTLLTGWRRWTSAFLVLLVAALIACVCAGDVATAGTLTGRDRAGLLNHAWLFGSFAAAVLVGSLHVLISFVVRTQRREYALWSLAGVGPELVRAVVLLQMTLLAVIAFAVALASTPVTLQVVLGLLSAPLRDPGATAPRAVLAPVPLLVALGAYLSLVVLSALAAGTTAARTPALLAVRRPEDDVRRRGRLRPALGWVLGALAAGMWGLTVFGAQGAAVMYLVPTIGCFLCAAPRIAPALLRAWTAGFPSTRGSVWFLARETALHQLTRSSASITLLAVAGMLGSLTGLMGLLDDPAYYGNALAVFGVPLGLVLFTGAATIIMESPARRRDVALVVVAGGTYRSALVVAVLEAAIVVGTAALITLPPALLAIPTAIGTWADPLRPVPLVLMAGFVLVLYATTTPVLASRRRTLGSQLVER